ncbi:molybdate ABC transporter substrate-binding protein [Lederbergia citrea]|uniref:molybdate ABC transporter substrate-binding protein n=1 Tax=Lederbergia citrea TaxID=2833581 RepID=UPI001BC940A6|nr:molybdate ABC transporter substrate-binding protein [Lederbergia citrea]MBS4178921.1 molybdate ABC transporter substrate-binding protein [Lederbergia citrea]MBS4205602.1 molybdate ABC transporter substrate-binding protein [Lederbergia citrea]
MTLMTACQPANKKVELTISAAASLQEALGEIKNTFEKDHPNTKILYNFGGSGALKQQISQGAPVDLFFSAAVDKFDELVNEGLIEKQNSTILIGNDLVLIVPAESSETIQSLADLLGIDKLAIGTPDSVPAGKYAEEALEAEGVLKAVSKKLVYTKDVRQVLTYVESGNVDAGIVYRTDALSSNKVRIAAAIDEKMHEPIVYPLGIVKTSKYQDEATTFYQYLQSEEALTVLKKYGFKGLEE